MLFCFIFGSQNYFNLISTYLIIIMICYGSSRSKIKTKGCFPALALNVWDQTSVHQSIISIDFSV